MPPTAQGSGTQSTTGQIGNELTLLDVAIAGVFQLSVDKFPSAAGDVTELRIYDMVLTAGTRRVAYFVRFFDVQTTDDMIAISVPIANDLTDAGSLRFTLKQTLGTAKNWPWKVTRLS
jgi:hypothetical protein